MIIVGIDLGIGVKSDFGLAAFESSDRTIKMAKGFSPKNKQTLKKIKELSDVFEDSLMTDLNKDFDLVCVERFVMQGKGGETLQRLMGAVMSRVPFQTEILEVHNMQLKQRIGLHGKASKLSIGNHLATFFKKNPDSHKIVRDLIDKQAWDIIDALAVAVYGYMEKGLDDV